MNKKTIGDMERGGEIPYASRPLTLAELSAANNRGAVKTTLTRGEALDAITEARRDGLEGLLSLFRQWIGHGQHDFVSADDAQEFLNDYVANACTSDEERSNGPQDSDDTGIPA